MELHKEPWSSNFESAETPVTFVLTGDGGREYSTLRGFCEIFNNRSGCLLFPKRPGKTKRSGFSALKAIKILTSKYKYENYLCVFDREHCQVEDVCQEISDQIKALGFEIVSFNCKTYCGNIGAHIQLRWGSHTVNLDLCIFGKELRIEENYVYLIERQYGDTIGLEKRDFHAYLAMKHMKAHELIIRSNRAYIRETFPFLYEIFQSYPPNY